MHLINFPTLLVVAVYYCCKSLVINKIRIKFLKHSRISSSEYSILHFSYYFTLCMDDFIVCTSPFCTSPLARSTHVCKLPCVYLGLLGGLRHATVPHLQYGNNTVLAYMTLW